MNLVGKILTVFIFVMSIFFCALAVGVYATHKNWRDVVMNPEDQVTNEKPLGLKFQKEYWEREYNTKVEEKNHLEARLTAERDAAVQALSQLDSKYVSLKDENDQLQKSLDQSDQERSRLLAQLEKTQTRLTALGREVEGDEDAGGATPGLRKDILQAQRAREQAVNEVIRLTDEKHHAVEELRRLMDHQKVLTEDLKNAVAVLIKHNLPRVPRPDQPPDVDGKVLSTGRYVEISLGWDDGLDKGHQLQVYRPGGSYVGRVEVLKTDFDKSVCQVVGIQNSRVQKNDLVASRILR